MLVVHDDESFVAFVEEVLTRGGIRVQVASDLAAGAAALRSGEYDAALLEPQVSGSRTFFDASLARRMARRSPMSRYVSTLVTLTLLLCGGAALQAQTVGPLPEGLRQDVTEQLVSDQWEAKRQAISRMLATPPEQRPSEWVSAVLDEVASFQLDSSTPEWIPAGEADHEVGWTLYGDMLEIACEARDERAIPVLVKAVSVGNPVIGALADFGDKAVQPIVEAMRNAAPDHVATSLSALALMVARHPTLSPAHKATISRLGRERLVGRQHPAMVRVAIEVAFAVKDADSLAALQRLSTAGSASAAGLEISFNPQSFPNLRERATLALEAAQTGRPLTRPGRPRTPR